VIPRSSGGGSRVRARTRLLAALAASAALHALAIQGFTLPVPAAPREQPLEARLAPAPAQKPAPVAAQPAAPQRSARAKPRAAPQPAAPAPLALAAPGPFAAFAEPEPEPAPAAEPPQEAAPAAEPAPGERVASAPPSLAAPLAQALPRRGRIAYTLYYGPDRGYVGRAVQSWEIEGEEYTIAADAETGGLVELFRPQRLRYVSHGRIGAAGLRPETFLVSRTRRGRTEAARARFDWQARSVEFGHAGERKSAALAEGTQDLASFFYQLALSPPEPGRLRVAIATGTKLEVQEFEVRPAESIETPLGLVRALPVRQVPKPDDESFEVWLAADYRYLPVRIRYYDREGRFSGEQVASEIRVSEE
jgi:hypothetical protein